MRKLLVVSVLMCAALSLIAAAMTKCRYCSMMNYGRGCPSAPDKIHRHIENDARCEYCGFTNYGRGCAHNPTKVHVHGSGNGKCVYCGMKNVMGKGCPHSPNGVHMK